MTGRISRWTVWVGWLLMLAVAIVGCGGGDEGTQEASPAPSAGASAPPATDVSEAATAGGGGQTYVVKSGDTLSAIARQFDTTVEAIVDANDIKNPDAIDVGEEFVIPAGR